MVLLIEKAVETGKKFENVDEFCLALGLAPFPPDVLT